MGNTFTHYTGNDKFQINSTSDIYAFALVGLTSQITYSLDSDWEASGEGTADGKYVYIFRHKPNAVRTASTFLDALVFTLISGSIPNDSTVHWVNGTTASYDGTQNSLTPFSGVTYNIEYSSTNAGSGSGDPHIVPLFNPLKRTYMLPTDNLIYKYFDNLDPENRVVINAKMWVLSNRYIGIIENLKKKESPLLKQAAKRIPEFWLKKYDKLDTSFMRYISVINGDERLIIDLEHLGIVGASDPSMLDKEVDDLTLEPTPAPSLNKIKVTGIQQYHRGIWAQKMIKMDNDNQNTFFRDIYIHTEKHGRITLRLVRMLDRYNHRTHLEMSFDDIRKSPGIENIWIIPSGIVFGPPNTASSLMVSCTPGCLAGPQRLVRRHVVPMGH